LPPIWLVVLLIDTSCGAPPVPENRDLPAGIFPAPQPGVDYVEVKKDFVRLGARLTGLAREVRSYKRVSGRGQLIGVVAVSGPDCCEFIDTNVKSGEMYTYWFTAIRPDGTETEGVGGIVANSLATCTM
jgi:hypothetical protein